jgi:hypothetical protein
MGPYSKMIGILIRRWSCEDRDIVQLEAKTCQKFPINHQKVAKEEFYKRFRVACPCWIWAWCWTSVFSIQNCEEKDFYCFKPPSLGYCYRSHKKVTNQFSLWISLVLKLQENGPSDIWFKKALYKLELFSDQSKYIMQRM